MTLADIYARAYDRLGEDSSDPQRYPKSLILTFLKEAVNQWSVAVGRDATSTQITVLDDTLEYTFTNQPVRIISVMDDAIDKPLIPVHWKELYDTEGFTRNRAWRDVQSDRPTHYTLFGYDKIWLWPTMASAGGYTITVNFLQETANDLGHYTVSAIAVNGAGTGYTAGGVLTQSGGSAVTAATYTVGTVDGSGVILTASVTTGGNYTTKPANGLPATGGTGSNATFNLTWTEDTTNVPTVPTEFQQLLVDYVVGRCLMIGSTGPNLQRGIALVQRWLESFDEQRARHRNIGAADGITTFPALRQF